MLSKVVYGVLSHQYHVPRDYGANLAYSDINSLASDLQQRLGLHLRDGIPPFHGLV